ncbi:MAG: MFS transporter [Bacteroidales bacterium]|nr:MFS transporter [Bacteroidales bacterium]
MEKEKLWNSNYIKVMATNFTLFFAFYLLTPLLPLYLSETYSASKDMIGLVLSGYTMVAILIRPFSGFLVDSFPRKKVLLVCLFVCFLFFGSYLVAGSLMLFAVIRTLHGGPFGACTVANSTMAIDVLPASRRNEGIGFYGISNNLASAVAPTVAIFIYHYVNDFNVLFWLAFIVAGLGLISAATLKVTPKPVETKKRKLSLDRFFLLRGWFLALNMCFFGFCWGVLSNYLAIYGKERLGITSGTGTFFMILSAGLILSRFWGNKTLREGKLTHNALEGIILSTIGYITFIAWPSMTGYYMTAALIGLGNGHIWPAFQNMIIAVAKHNERGTANSTILTSWDLGIGLGVLLGGVIAEYFGYTTIFCMIAAVHVVGLVYFLGLTRNKFKKTSSGIIHHE